MSNRKQIDREYRAATALAWRQAHQGGETQAEFCARQVPRIQPRTLRQWLKNHARADLPAEQTRMIIRRAIGDLQSLLAALDRSDSESACLRIEPDSAPDGTPHGFQAKDPANPAPARSGRSFDWDL